MLNTLIQAWYRRVQTHSNVSLPAIFTLLLTALMLLLALPAGVGLAGMEVAPAATSTSPHGPSPTPTRSPTCVPPDWRSVPLASTTPDTYLYAVDTISRDDAWAVGRWSDINSIRPHIQRWDGQAWSVVPNAPGSPNTNYELRITNYELGSA